MWGVVDHGKEISVSADDLVSTGTSVFTLLFIAKQGKLLQLFVKGYNFNKLDLLFRRCFLSFDSAVNEVSENRLLFLSFFYVFHWYS